MYTDRKRVIPELSRPYNKAQFLVSFHIYMPKYWLHYIFCKRMFRYSKVNKDDMYDGTILVYQRIQTIWGTFNLEHLRETGYNVTLKTCPIRPGNNVLSSWAMMH